MIAPSTEFYMAYLGIQNDLESISKNRTGRFKYADLNCLMDAVRPILQKHQMVICPGVNQDENHTFLVTKLIHAPTGQGVASWVPLKAFDDAEYTDQIGGGNMSYQRRYALMVMLNITLDDDPADDDGQSNYDRKQQYKASAPNGSVGTVITLDKVNTLNTLLSDLPNGKLLEKNILAFNKIGSLGQLNSTQYDRALNYIKENAGK